MTDDSFEFKNPFLRALFVNPQWLIFWIAAALILFVNLGIGSVHGSEGRWLTISAEMLRNKDFLHPSINGQLYFDKPLLSYWFIVIVAFFNGGVVNEFVARVPGALSALLGLWSVVLLGRKLWNDKVALSSGWILLTIYSFAYYGRMAEADTENMVFTFLAVVWYLFHRDKKSIFAYAVFWIICAVGANLKGLGALVIPPLVVAVDVAVQRCWFKHFNWRFFLGLIIGLAVYAIPLFLTSLADSSASGSGLYLVFRENIQRFFDPFDHKDDPFWIYFVFLPQLFAPWSPILILALISAAIGFKKASNDERWLILSIALIFLIFSLSGSRRIYYIMPILPFCALLCGVYLNTKPAQKWLELITRWLIIIYARVLCIAPYLLFLIPVIFFFIPDGELKNNITASRFIIGAVYVLAPLFGIIGVSFQLYDGWRKKKGRNFILTENYPQFLRSAKMLWLTLFIAFCVMLPYVSSDPAFRTRRTFAEDMHKELFVRYGFVPEQIRYYKGRMIDFNYYLNSGGVIPYIGVYGESEDEAMSRLTAFITALPEHGGAIIMEREDFDGLPEILRAVLESGERFSEPLNVFDDDVFKKDETLLSEKNLKSLKKKQYKIIKKKYTVFAFSIGKTQ